jgi:hypothetical protein
MHIHLSLVNQKLAFATAMLSIADGFSVEPARKQKLQLQACYEAVLLHTFSAFHFYLRELAENNRVKNPDAIDSLRTLIEALKQLDKSPSEVNELDVLANQSGSWLSSLLLQHAMIFQSPAKQPEKKSFGNDSLIEIIDLGQQHTHSVELNSALLNEWIDAFKTLILRQRETGAEY